MMNIYDLISILSGERLESIQFSLHVQRQNDLLAVEIPKCTPYFEGHRSLLLSTPCI